MRRYPGPPAPKAAPRPLADTLIRTVLMILIAAAAAALSVVASAFGLTLLLVVLAVGSLVMLKIREQRQGGYTPHRSRRAMLAVGLGMVGFFLTVSVVAAYWPK